MSEYVQYIQALGMPEGWEWFVILIVALLLFGKNLPNVARGLGKSLNQFKKGMSEVEDTKDEVVDEVKKTGDDISKQARDTAKLNEPKNTN
jgi:sec-independent protein translocase protein TatA